MLGEQQKESHKKLNSILLGVIICSNMIVGAIDYFISVNNLFAIMVFSVGIIFIVYNLSNMAFRLSWLVLMSIFLIQSFIGALLINNQTANHYFFSFLCVGIVSAICGYQDIDVFVLTKTIVMISILTVWHPLDIISKGQFALSAESQMGIAYSFLPALFSGVILLSLKEKKYSRLSIIVVVLSVSVLFFQMTRGALVSGLVFLLGVTVVELQEQPKKILKVGCIIIALLLALLVFSQYIVASEWYYKIFKFKENDILNGRGELYNQVFVWKGIGKCLFGNGCGSYQNFAVDDVIFYPHNLFLQLYFEQGLFVTCIVVGICIKSVVTAFKRKTDKKQKQMIWFLFSASIVRLMVSYYFWVDPIFWTLISYILYKKKRSCK